MASLTVVDPTLHRSAPQRHQLTDRPTTVDGMVVGFREFWPKFDVFTTAFEGLLTTKYDVRGVERVDGTHPRSGPVLERWEEFGRTVDWAISGLGGCGGCAPWAVMDACELEARGVPTVTLITPDLVGVARMLGGRDPSAVHVTLGGDAANAMYKLGNPGAEATVGAIAANAVMAGCTPAYFPAVLAALTAMTTNGNGNAFLSSVAPMLV